MRTNYEPKERIYLYLYNKPSTKEELSKILYGNRNSRAWQYLKQMHKNKWITLKYQEDLRKSPLCHTTSKAIVDSILEDIDLKPVEIKKLTDFFSRPAAIQFIKENITNIGIEKISFDRLKDIISFFSIYVYIFAQYSASKKNVSLSVALKKVKNPKTKDVEEIKEIVVSFFNKIAPSAFQTNVDSIKNSYMDFFFEFVTYMNVPLLIKLCELNSNANGYFLLGSALFAWKETVDREKKIRI